jgi:dGTPase
MQIATSIARQLNLNADVVCAISLGHDLGHTPFGHAGEDALDDIANDKLNQLFKHNIQSLRVIDELADDYMHDEIRGLNLTRAVREGILKHTDYIKLFFDTSKDRQEYTNILRDKYKELDIDCLPSLEAQLVNISDEIAQRCHDLDDGIRAGVVSLSELIPIINIYLNKIIKDKYHSIRFVIKAKEFLEFNNKYIKRYRQILGSHPKKDTNQSDKFIYPAFRRRIIDLFCSDLLISSKNRLKRIKRREKKKCKLSKEDINDILNNKKDISSFFTIIFSKIVSELESRLKEFQSKRSYNNSHAQKRNERAKYFIKCIFETYLNNPLILSNDTLVKYFYRINPKYIKYPEQWLDYNEVEDASSLRTGNKSSFIANLKNEPRYIRLIIDHIAGMTDSYLQKQFESIYTPFIIASDY